MAVKSVKSRQVLVWVPPVYGAEYKVTVETADGTVYDLTDSLMSFEFDLFTTDAIGKFEFTIPNGSGEYDAVFTGMEIVRLYVDYALTATTCRFRGRIEKPASKDFVMTCSGRDESLFVFDKTVTKQYANIDTGLIVKDLFDTYGEGRYTYNNLNLTSGRSITVNWYNKPFWDCIKECCQSAAFECYVDGTVDVHYFEVGSVFNTVDAVVHDYNLIEIGDFTKDLSQIKNKVTLYGAQENGAQVVYTAKDTAANRAFYGTREVILNDNNVTNETQAQELVDYSLLDQKSPPLIGDAKTAMLASAAPGEYMRVSAPGDMVPFGYYRVLVVKHALDSDGLFTTISINKEKYNLANVIATRVSQEYAKNESFTNPNALETSWTNRFDAESGAHTGTQIANGFLLSTGGAGTWISDARALSSNLSQAILVMEGDNVLNATVSISGNGGISYDVLPMRVLTTVGATGQSFRIKVEIPNATVTVDSIQILYSTV